MSNSFFFAALYCVANLQLSNDLLVCFYIFLVDAETALYTELWRACAGPLVTVPRENELVFYFPQGHIEQVYSCMSFFIWGFKSLIDQVFIVLIILFPSLLCSIN